MIGRSRRPTVARFKKEGSFLWKLGGDAHHYRFFLKSTEVYEPSVRQPWQQSHKMLELYNGLNIFNDVI
jgi:hypothetical protein